LRAGEAAGSSVALAGRAEEHWVVLRITAGRRRVASTVVTGFFAGVHPALLAVLPEEHLLGERDIAAEQRADGFAAVNSLDRLADQRRDGQPRDLRQALDRRQRNRVREDD